MVMSIFVYVMFAPILFFGLISGKPTVKIVLVTAYPGLDEAGWHKLTRNWGLFFIAMALLNEAVWRTQSTDFWIAFKLWGVVPLSLVFAMAQATRLRKHGMKLDKAAQPITPHGRAQARPTLAILLLAITLPPQAAYKPHTGRAAGMERGVW